MKNRIKEILREGLITEITVNDAWAKFYSNIEKFPALKGDESLFHKLNNLYPRRGDNFNKGYFTWLYNLIRTNQLKEEDFYKAKEYLRLFDKFINKIPVESRDINKFKNLNDLYDVVREFEEGEDTMATSKTSEIKQIKQNEIDKVYEDNEWLIMIPKTKRASCLIGKGTQWCTAADQSNNMFDSHNSQGPLYVMVDKYNDEKYQLHFETNQLMDATDRPISASYFFDHIMEGSGAFTFLQESNDKFWDFVLETSAEDMADGGYSETFEEALHSDVTPYILKNTLNTLRYGDDSHAKYLGYVYEKDPNNISTNEIENLFNDNEHMDDDDLVAILRHLIDIEYDFDENENGDIKKFFKARLDLEKHKIELDVNYQVDKNRTLRVNRVSVAEENPYYITMDGKSGNVDLETLLNLIHQGHLFEGKSFIKQLLRETLITEIRVINPNNSYNRGTFTSMENEPPLHDNETIRVYHGFNKYDDAVMAAKFGFSGEEKARRIYSYESNNNPNGLFVTLDYKTAEKFAYPSGSRGIKVVLELSVKVADLEAPVWPGGTYTVQGQMSQYWKDAEDRNINGTLKAREEASLSKIPFVRDSDRPEVANALLDYERQALFIGNINPNMIKSVFFGESGKHGYNPKTMERISRQEFLNKFETHEPEQNSDGRLTDKGEQYNKRKDRIFKPNDNFNMEIFNKECIENEWDKTGIEMLKKLQKYRYLDNIFWPKQIKQINDLLENYE